MGAGELCLAGDRRQGAQGDHRANRQGARRGETRAGAVGEHGVCAAENDSPHSELRVGGGAVRGAAMGFRQGAAGEDESECDPFSGPNSEAIDPPHRRAVAEASGDLSAADDGDERGRTSGVDMGRCVLPAQADPGADGGGDDAGQQEQVSADTDQ